MAVGLPQAQPVTQAPRPQAPLPYVNTAKALGEDAVKDWKARIITSKDPIATIIEEGKTNVARYRVKNLLATPKEAEVVVPLDYSYTEQKKAQLFFQVPEVQLTASRPEAEASAPVAQAVINTMLGPKPVGVDAKTAVWEALTDVVCPTGYGVCKIGYTNVVHGKKSVQVGQEPDPAGQPGSILGLSAPMRPVMQEVPNIVSETYYWKRIPPGHFRAPNDFVGSDFDESPWLASRFSEDVVHGSDQKGTSHSDDDNMLLTPPQHTSRSQTPKRWGTEVFYQARRFDPTCPNPLLIRTFKLYDDEDVERDHKDSPDQRWAADGSLIGMAGYPLHVLTLRYTSDTCFPASDVSQTRQTVDEISKGRTQLVRRRDRSLPQVGYDATAVTPESLAKIEAGDNTAFVGFARPVDDSTFKEIPKGTFGRENFAFNDQGQRDLDTAWALGASAGVLRADSPETATKSQQIQSAVDTRLEAERTRVLEYLVKGAMKLLGLIQVNADQQDYVRLGGEAAAGRLAQWDKTQIPGPYAFSAKPNSHVRIDAAYDREQALRFYQLTGQDPYVNRAETVKMVALKFGLDPAKVLKQPDPKGPDPASASVSFKIEDFIGPGAPIAIELAAQAGYKISPAAMQATQGFAQIWGAIQAEQAAAAEQQKAAQKGQPKAGDTEHGGSVQGIPPVDKHQQDLTGGLPGIGAAR
jgi:hypothetical protein